MKTPLSLSTSNNARKHTEKHRGRGGTEECQSCFYWGAADKRKRKNAFVAHEKGEEWRENKYDYSLNAPQLDLLEHLQLLS